jgi:uncharacterized integral membrane protein
MKKEMVATRLNQGIISLCVILFFAVINFTWRIIGMIFGNLKCPTKLDIYFGVNVGVVSWTITHINRVLPQIEYLQCAAMKTSNCW